MRVLATFCLNEAGFLDRFQKGVSAVDQSGRGSGIWKRRLSRGRSTCRLEWLAVFSVVSESKDHVSVP